MDYSDNFIVFWEKGFGSNPFTVTDQALRVDIKDLLEKAELFYDVNVNKLKFVETGKSNTDKYRMMIFLKFGIMKFNRSFVQFVGKDLYRTS